MSRRRLIICRIIGGALGVAMAGYGWVYVPMKRNHDQCGRVTLCENAAAGSQE